MALEVEFYLPGGAGAALIEETCRKAGGSVEKIEPERGENQWEIAFSPTRDIPALTGRASALRGALVAAGADFRAKPFPDRPGSGLHVHLHLEHAEGEAGQGRNLFYKKDEIISDALKWSIGGLLATMRENLHHFIPRRESLARLMPGGGGPVTASWGANNRSCAIRLPDAGAPYRHIEHRVAGADADFSHVAAAVLAGVRHGLEHRCDPGPQIYGDAALDMYGLPRIADWWSDRSDGSNRSNRSNRSE